MSNTDSMRSNVIEGQVYVNVSPPVGGASVGARLRSRSYDRNLDKTPQPRLGSLERMLSCPVRLSEGSSPGLPPPPRVTSFAEIARNKKKNGGSPSQKTGAEASSVHSHSSGEFSPILEDLSSLINSPHWSAPLRASPGGAAKETRTKAEGKGAEFNVVCIVLHSIGIQVHNGVESAGCFWYMMGWSQMAVDLQNSTLGLQL